VFPTEWAAEGRIALMVGDEWEQQVGWSQRGGHGSTKAAAGLGMDSMPCQQSINWVSLIVGCRMVKSDGRGVFWEYAD